MTAVFRPDFAVPALHQRSRNLAFRFSTLARRADAVNVLGWGGGWRPAKMLTSGCFRSSECKSRSSGLPNGVAVPLPQQHSRKPTVRLPTRARRASAVECLALGGRATVCFQARTLR
jgi:hypothetical protein